jgi:beta-lactam-binding protein with PASTA domain
VRDEIRSPVRHFYVSVSAKRHALVNRIVDSAEAVSRGYTAVPSVVGTRRSVAIHRLIAAGLVLHEPKRPIASCCDSEVTTQAPAAGSVVKAGATFRLRG